MAELHTAAPVPGAANQRREFHVAHYRSKENSMHPCVAQPPSGTRPSQADMRRRVFNGMRVAH